MDLNSFWSTPLTFLGIRRKYINLNKVIVDSSAITNNFKKIQKYHSEARVCPVVKSNAYGHGLSLTAHVFDNLNAPFLIVDSLYEAYELYKLRVKTPVLIMGYTNSENLKVKSLPFHYAIFDTKTASVLNKYQPGCRVHIFLDTGMCREGVPLSSLEDFVKSLKRFKNIRIEGLCSHFSDADNTKDLTFTQLQVNNYKSALKILAKYDIKPKWRHISASAGSYKFKDSTFNMLRIGFAIYGVSPLKDQDAFSTKFRLQPALKFVSTIVQIKTLAKGSEVGYSRTYKTLKRKTIALIPAGYYDGVDRRLSNKGFVKIHDEFCKVLGRVSMNMFVVDVSDMKVKPEVGQEVVIYSNIQADKNSVSKVAKLVKTIPYDILVHIPESVKRICI